jgi:hypothetical protein
MKPWITLSRAELRDQRPAGETEDVHFTELLARAIITEFSIPGDLVLDPFAGLGTTLYVACQLVTLRILLPATRQWTATTRPTCARSSASSRQPPACCSPRAMPLSMLRILSQKALSPHWPGTLLAGSRVT